MFKLIKIGVLGLAAAGLGAAALFGTGAVFAQDETPDAPPDRPAEPLRGSAYKDAYDQALAAELGVSVDDLLAARETAKDAALDIMVENGDLTQDEADAIRDRAVLQAMLKDERDSILADALGISADELEAARAEGKTIREIAEEQGIDLADLQATIESAFETRLQELVDAGTITQEQADRLLSRADHAPHPGPRPNGQRPHNAPATSGEGA